MFEGDRKSTKKGLEMGVTIGVDDAKVEKNSFVSGNVHKVIAENWSTQLEKLESIKKGNSYTIRTKSVRNYWSFF